MKGTDHLEANGNSHLRKLWRRLTHDENIGMFQNRILAQSLRSRIARRNLSECEEEVKVNHRGYRVAIITLQRWYKTAVREHERTRLNYFLLTVKRRAGLGSNVTVYTWELQKEKWCGLKFILGRIKMLNQVKKHLCLVFVSNFASETKCFQVWPHWNKTSFHTKGRGTSLNKSVL